MILLTHFICWLGCLLLYQHASLSFLSSASLGMCLSGNKWFLTVWGRFQRRRDTFQVRRETIPSQANSDKPLYASLGISGFSPRTKPNQIVKSGCLRVWLESSVDWVPWGFHFTKSGLWESDQWKWFPLWVPGLSPPTGFYEIGLWEPYRLISSSDSLRVWLIYVYWSFESLFEIFCGIGWSASAEELMHSKGCLKYVTLIPSALFLRLVFVWGRFQRRRDTFHVAFKKFMQLIERN